MVELEPRRIGEHRLEVGRGIVAARARSGRDARRRGRRRSAPGRAGRGRAAGPSSRCRRRPGRAPSTPAGRSSSWKWTVIALRDRRKGRPAQCVAPERRAGLIGASGGRNRARTPFSKVLLSCPVASPHCSTTSPRSPSSPPPRSTMSAPPPAGPGVKAAGVVVDDTAVTPRYVTGFTPDRELPIIWRIAKGSLRNKLLIILPAALALSALLPWAITPLLMLGGAYLCFEGAEKVWHALADQEQSLAEVAAELNSADHEREMVVGRDPHRLHPLGRDHGDRARRGRDRAVRDARGDPRLGRGRDHRRRLRRGRADREDGRCRPSSRRAAQPRLARAGPGAGPRHAEGDGGLVGDRHRRDDLGRRRHHRPRARGVRPRRARARHPRRRRRPPAMPCRRCAAWSNGRSARPARACSGSPIGAVDRRSSMHHASPRRATATSRRA